MPETQTLALTDIAGAKNRLRTLRDENVTALAQFMADQGLLQPIVVRPNKRGGYDPIAGIHRLEAAKQLNWTTISCIVLDAIDADQAELIEIDENLIRAELSPAERAIHIGRRKKLYEKLHPETKATKAGGPGRAKTRRQIGDDIAERFTRNTAKKTSRPERTIQRDATRAQRVPVLPDIIGTSLDSGAEIDALAKLPAAEQRSFAEAAKRGENVSAIVARGVGDSEGSRVSDGTEEIELGKVIARVRRAQPHNKDTMLICDALERRLHRHRR
jgi:ParB-like chromosome segregation protein Spo0J